MKPVRLIIAVALLAVVGGALWWSNRDEKAKEGKPAADAPPQILSIKPDDVKQLEIKRQGHDAITVVFNDKGKWDITFVIGDICVIETPFTKSSFWRPWPAAMIVAV